MRDPIEIVNLDVSPSPVMDKATSSEPIGNHMSVRCSHQNVEQGELATSGDETVASVVKLVNSEIVVPSNDQIEIAAVTRSQSKQKSDVDDGNTGSVTLSDETKRMDMTKFKEMQESDSSLHALWIKTTRNDSRYCISNDLLYERSRKIDDP